MPLYILILALILAIIIIITIVFSCLRIRQRKYDDFVLKNSSCLKRLNEINGRYKFHPYVNFDQYHAYDNEKIYDTISCEDYLIYQLQYIAKRVSAQIKNIYDNGRLYSDYLNEVSAVSDFGKFQAPTKNLNLEKLIAAERTYFERWRLHKPAVQFSVRVTLSRTNINGYVHERKADVFYDDDISALIKRLDNKRGTFFNDRGIWDSICRVERGKVSNKMRFAILDRDGHRCRNCGVSDKVTNLEIDHIIPLQRAGRARMTTYRRCAINAT